MAEDGKKGGNAWLAFIVGGLIVVVAIMLLFNHTAGLSIESYGIDGEFWLRMQIPNTAVLLADLPNSRAVMSIKLTQYLITGRPILALSPRVGVVADWLGRGGGIVVDPDDAAGIAEALERLHGLWEAGRLDESAHPFTEGLHPRDVRLTTRYREDDFTGSMMSTAHETGHARFQQNLPREDGPVTLLGREGAEGRGLARRLHPGRLFRDQGRAVAYR